MFEVRVVRKVEMIGKPRLLYTPSSVDLTQLVSSDQAIESHIGRHNVLGGLSTIRLARARIRRTDIKLSGVDQAADIHQQNADRKTVYWRARSAGHAHDQRLWGMDHFGLL